jgi:hypothetical protein
MTLKNKQVLLAKRPHGWVQESERQRADTSGVKFLMCPLFVSRSYGLLLWGCRSWFAADTTEASI